MIYREGLGRPLTWQELDENFKEVGQQTNQAASSASAAATSAAASAASAVQAENTVVKITPRIRESLRRTYTEAGYNLVEGSFEDGGTVTTTDDVLLYELDNHAYKWDGTFPVGGKVIPKGSTPASTGGVGTGLWVDQGDASLRRELSESNGTSYIGGLPFYSAFGDLSLSSDNTAGLNEYLNWGRTTGKTVELPAGNFPVSGELELGGVKVRGKSVGFRNSDGTVLVGSGQDRMFNQSSSAFPYFAATKIESVAITNVVCGIEFGYLVRAEFEDVHVTSTGTSIRFGRSANSGPQFNSMRRCTAESNGGSALYMNGSNWCNNNSFEQCFFESKNNLLTPAVVIDAAGGYGAIGNIFLGTEVASDGFGIQLKNARATQFLGAYLECKGPAIYLKGTSYGTKLSGGVIARQRNDNNTGINWAVYHESGNASIEIDKPYIVASTPAEQDGCGFIGFEGDVPVSSFVVDMISEPHTELLGGVNYIRYKNNLFRAVTKRLMGDVIISTNSSPSMSLQHEDGSKKVEIYSNSASGGSDFGAVLKVNDTTRMQLTPDNKILLAGQKLGLSAEGNVNPPGAKTHRIQVLNESGGFLGYLAVYAT